MNVIRLAFAVAALSLLALPSRAQELEPGVLPKSAFNLVESTADGPHVTGMRAAAIASYAHTGSNLARGAVFGGQHNTVELAGLTATLTVHTTTPTFYVKIDPEDPNDMRAQLTLLRLKPGKDTRQVLNMTANSFGGGRKRKGDEVAVTKSDVSGGWLKITPQAPLEPGEYGLMFLPANATLFSDRVYDFHVEAGSTASK